MPSPQPRKTGAARIARTQERKNARTSPLAPPPPLTAATRPETTGRDPTGSNRTIRIRKRYGTSLYPYRVPAAAAATYDRMRWVENRRQAHRQARLTTAQADDRLPGLEGVTRAN